MTAPRLGAPRNDEVENDRARRTSTRAWTLLLVLVVAALLVTTLLSWLVLVATTDGFGARPVQELLDGWREG